nr:mitogen-activated protein kinase 9-like isoform X1 [Tanacetum cinerariifolium]
NVFHRDLKPKNISTNADCKLKICGDPEERETRLANAPFVDDRLPFRRRSNR